MSVFSVFVGNIPTTVHWRWLRNHFHKQVNVIDVFLSQVRIPSSTRFGFVRFKNAWEEEKAIQVFNGSSIFNKSITVAWPKGRNRTQFWRKKISSPTTNPTVVDQTGDKDKVIDEKLSCSAMEDLEFTKALDWCITGEPIGGANDSWIQMELSKLGLVNVNARKGPAGLILLMFNNKSCWQDNLNNGFCLMKSWLRNIRFWKDVVIPRDRRAWLVIHGLPLKLWSFYTFENIASIWGSLISLCEKTRLKLDLSRGFMQIRCSQSSRIDEYVKLLFKGRSFIIRVTEIEACESVLDYDKVIQPVGSAAGDCDSDEDQSDGFWYSGGRERGNGSGTVLESVDPNLVSNDAGFLGDASGEVSSKCQGINNVEFQGEGADDDSRLAGLVHNDSILPLYCAYDISLLQFGPSDDNLIMFEEEANECSLCHEVASDLEVLDSILGAEFFETDGNSVDIVDNSLVHNDLINMGFNDPFKSHEEVLSRDRLGESSKTKLKSKPSKSKIGVDRFIPGMSNQSSGKGHKGSKNGSKSRSSSSSSSSLNEPRKITVENNIPPKKPRSIDPNVSWKFSKNFSCTSNLSDEAMIERNRYLDSLL